MSRSRQGEGDDAEPTNRAEQDRLGELYARFAPAAMRLTYLMTGDSVLAQDLVQEAFLRMGGRLQPTAGCEPKGARGPGGNGGRAAAATVRASG